MMTADNLPLRNTPPGPAEVERPLAVDPDGHWGSDVIAGMLRALDLPYAALNPGASYRGLHDSLVNHLGNERPQMLLCLHEEHAVAIAHGWAKVTERPMVAIVHSNVGLMHATMAVFNAWCDRVPMLLLGATGPVDAQRRRPWIDWIHTAKDQGALIRSYTKWDDQPASAGAAIESLLRAVMIAETAPRGPTYVCLDAGLQETRLDQIPELPDPQRFRPPPSVVPAPTLIEAAAERLLTAERPVILAGRVSRNAADWDRRIRFAEMVGAIVVTDLKAAAAFPTTHRLHGPPAGGNPTDETLALLRNADVVLSLDWIDLGGTLKSAWGQAPVSATVIQVSVDQYIHNGWSMDHQGLPPVDLYLMSEPDPTTAALLTAMERLGGRKVAAWPTRPTATLPVARATAPAEGPITVPTLAAALTEATEGQDVCLVRGPNAWAGRFWKIEHPLDYLGIDGGGGLASGPGLTVGVALALQGTGRLPVSVLGDGDFLMGVTALWTAVHYAIPLLIIVANNRSFYNDEVHQERIARQRGRLVANKWIGQHITGPDIDLAMLARGQGALGLGPVERFDALGAVLNEAIAAVRNGQVVVVDVIVEPGYDPATTSVMLRPTAQS
jgi:thiamine pyrophosphate-dependent acetolactate synthase large subunit-like protein